MASDNNWRVIKPQASTNYVLNPSGEIAGNFSAVAGATTTRVTTFQKYGLYSYRVQTVASGDGLQLTLSALTNTTHFVTARIRGPHPDLQFSIGGNAKTARLIEKVDGRWNLYGASFTAGEANGQTAVQILATGTLTSGDFNVDGVQVEPLAFWTTYIDGTQEGCEWLGAVDASISQRSGQSRAGGISQDLWLEYGFFVEKVVGAGATGKKLGIDSFALLPGGELNNIKVEPRVFTIIGRFCADTEIELHNNRQELLSIFSNDEYPADQPILLRFNGAAVQKEIGVHYQGGLEGDLGAFYDNFEVDGEEWIKLSKFTEKASLQLSAPNPYWLETGESAALLDTNDSATFRTIAARLRSTGQWDELGPPGAGGAYTNVRAIVEDDTYVYIGGFFTNWDGIANADYIVRYNKQTGAYSALDVGLNNTVFALAIASNGDLYIGGDFTNAGGVAAADYIARWDGTNFNAVGTPNTGAAAITSIDALKFDLAGNLYVGGNYVNLANIANADGIAVWDGSSYSALSTGVSGSAGAVFALEVLPDNDIILGGDFTSPSTNIAGWDGSAFYTLGSGLNFPVSALEVTRLGLLYAGGTFTSPTDGIALWNGTAWVAVGIGTGGAAKGVFDLSVDEGDVLYLGGEFTEAGGIDLADRVARYNGHAFAHLDANFPGAPTVFSVVVSRFADPVVSRNYDLWLGFNTTGTGNFAGLVTPDNEGGIIAFPKIVYNRSGGTSAVIETLRNERSGRELLFDYSLLDGETLTIDLSPTNKSIISSIFGSRLDAILANSDFGTWSLLPGDNNITSFVNVAGGPTVTAYMLWRDGYDGFD